MTNINLVIHKQLDKLFKKRLIVIIYNKKFNFITFGFFQRLFWFVYIKNHKKLSLLSLKTKNTKKVYIIRPGTSGLYSIVHKVILSLIYAKQNGYIPIIDMKFFIPGITRVLET